MNLWLWIGIPLLFLLGVIVNAIKDMKRLEKQLPKYLDKVRPIPDDEEEEWPARSLQKPTDPHDPPPPSR
ncbi:MAG: hypothetical protein QMB40_04090 [Aeromonadaceae bacterium]